MRILYVTSSYIPSRQANSVQVMKMCAAFARRGHHVTLLAKSAQQKVEAGVQDDFAFYNVPNAFRIAKLPRRLRRGAGLLDAVRLWRELRARRRETALVYTRNVAAGMLAAQLGMPTVFESHNLPRVYGSFAFRRLVRSPTFVRLVVTTRGQWDYAAARGLRPSTWDVVVAPNASDPLPDALGGNGEMRRSWGAEPQLGYVGNLYPGKGVEIVVALAKEMPDATFHIVGGQRQDLEAWEGRQPPPNARFHGFVRQTDLARYYAAFDILLLPMQGGEAGAGTGGHVHQWNSPLKTFEYMASGKPIVASDLPVLREVLTDHVNALLVTAGDVAAWHAAVHQLVGHPDLARRLGAEALQDFNRLYTADARARRVLAGLEGT